MRLAEILALFASAGGWIATLLLAVAPHTKLTVALLPVTILIGFGAFLTARRMSRQPKAQ